MKIVADEGEMMYLACKVWMRASLKPLTFDPLPRMISESHSSLRLLISPHDCIVRWTASASRSRMPPDAAWKRSGPTSISRLKPPVGVLLSAVPSTAFSNPESAGLSETADCGSGVFVSCSAPRQEQTAYLPALVCSYRPSSSHRVERSPHTRKCFGFVWR